MVKYALTKNISHATPPGKAVKNFTHAECGTPMDALKGGEQAGQFFCPECRKTGYPVKQIPWPR